MQTASRYVRQKIEKVLKKYPSAYDEVIIADLYQAFSQLIQEFDQARDKESSWKHPAIMAVREVCREFIPAGLVPEIIIIVGETPNKKLMRECYLEWHTRGKSSSGWGWILEWYRDGIPARFKKPVESDRSLPFDV